MEETLNPLNLSPKEQIEFAEIMEWLSIEQVLAACIYASIMQVERRYDTPSHSAKVGAKRTLQMLRLGGFVK